MGAGCRISRRSQIKLTSYGGTAMSDSCCGDDRTVLIYACSGGANVAEVSDLAARQLMAEKEGSMFCLAGLGADIEGMIETAEDADQNLVIDGCPMDCAKKIFDRVGVTNYEQIKVTDLGIEKVKGVRATQDQVERTVQRAREVLNGA
ncbi:MAG: putative zinc-binding protein [Planctomycetota bacterium]